MKHLIDYICEDNRQDLIDFIKGKATDDDIKKLYNTFIKITGKGDDDKKHFDMLDEWISMKMINDTHITHSKTFKRAILSACDEWSCYNEVFNLMRSQMKNDEIAFYPITFDTVTFDEICTYYKNNFNIPKSFFDELFETESAGEPTIGKGEYLLRLISTSPIDNDNKAIVGGDVIINGFPIEVKNLTGTMGKNDEKIKPHECNLGNSQMGNCKPIYDFLNTFAKDTKDAINYESITLAKKPRNAKHYEKIIKAIKNIKKYANSEDFLIDDLVDDFIIELNTSFFKTERENYFENFRDPIEKTIEALININTDDNTNNIIENFIKIFTTLYIILYCGSESEKTKTYLCLIMKDKSFKFYDSSLKFEDLYKMDIPIYQIRYSSGKSFVQLIDNK